MARCLEHECENDTDSPAPVKLAKAGVARLPNGAGPASTRDAPVPRRDPDERRALGEHCRDLELRLKRMIRARDGRSSAGSLSADDVNEIVQETLCRAIQALDASRYDGTRHLLPYLAGISFNVLSDLKRARSRHCRRGAMLEALALHSSDPCASEIDLELEFDQRSELVRGWLAQQPPPVQQLCHRRFWLGESQRVAAATLNLSRQQVRTLERQIRSSLSRHLIDAADACGRRTQ